MEGKKEKRNSGDKRLRGDKRKEGVRGRDEGTERMSTALCQRLSSHPCTFVQRALIPHSRSSRVVTCAFLKLMLDAETGMGRCRQTILEALGEV